MRRNRTGVGLRLAALLGAVALMLTACGGGSSSSPSPFAAQSASRSPAPGSGVPTTPAESPAARPSLSIAPASFSLKAPVQRAVATEDGSGNILLAGGLDTAEQSVAEVYSIDPATGHVKRSGSMADPFHDAAGAFLGKSLVVFGGGTSEGTDVVQSFDPKTGASSQTATYPVLVSDLSSAAVGGTVYLVAGWDGRKISDKIYSTTDGRTFRVAGSLPDGLRYAAVAVSGSTLIVVGGMDTHGLVSTVTAFDTSTGKSRSLGTLPQPLAHGAAFTLGGIVYVAGGQDEQGNAVDTIFSIDPATGKVRTLDPLRKPVSDAAVVQTADSAWLLGGWRGRATDQVLEASLS